MFTSTSVESSGMKSQEQILSSPIKDPVSVKLSPVNIYFSNSLNGSDRGSYENYGERVKNSVQRA